MRITRHFVEVAGRRVHYRMAGAGPPLLLVHQSPRSSAEYKGLLARWSGLFTCIAPDSPGFGQSDRLPGAPELQDFADALIAFLDAVGLDRVGAYGFHSGALIVIAALGRHPQRFSAAAVGGYAVWTEAERAAFGATYIPPFQPLPYGEHLTWLWSRILEQSWFFPWYDARPESRLPRAHAEPARVDAIVREMLDSGDAYRAGYGAVLRALRGIPAADAKVPPVLFTAYDGDPLQAHLRRLGELPAGWSAHAVPTLAAHEEASFAFLRDRPAPAAGSPRQSPAEGFAACVAPGFDGLIHWRGARDADRVVLHAPGESVELLQPAGALHLDLPGHGLSDSLTAEADLSAWARLLAAAIRTISLVPAPMVVGCGESALLALAVARELGSAAEGEHAHLPLECDAPEWLERQPDLTPDRFGGYLTQAWAIVRAARFFWPWFCADAAHAIPFEARDVEPTRLALRHRSLIRARSAKALLRALLQADRGRLVAEAPAIRAWRIAAWARGRSDIWQPGATAGEIHGNS